MVFYARLQWKAAGIKAVKEELRRAVGDFFRDFADAILKEADIHVPVGATEALKLSGHRIPPNPTNWAMVRYTAPYAYYVHEGTRAHFPPSDELERWVELVLNITDEKEVKSVAFLIARAISKRGTKPDPWLRNAFEKIEPKAQANLNRKLDEAMGRLRARFGGK